MALSVDSSSSLQPTTPSVDNTDLATGAAGDAVRQLQQQLKAAGFSPGAVDGKFGAHTAQAVRAFQKASSLPQTGAVDATTAAALAQAPTAIQRSLHTDCSSRPRPRRGPPAPRPRRRPTRGRAARPWRPSTTRS